MPYSRQLTEPLPILLEKNIVNPSSLLLSAVMMLDYMGWTEAGSMIEKAMENTFRNHQATIDLARFMKDSRTLSTTEFKDTLISNL